jgi:enoyl-CoA hydratase/carnithine racemase
MRTDYKTVRVEVRDGVAVFVLDNPPVNQLSGHFVREIADAVAEAFKDNSVKARGRTSSPGPTSPRSRT